MLSALSSQSAFSHRCRDFSIIWGEKSCLLAWGKKIKLNHSLVESACPALTLWFNYSCNLMSLTDACFFSVLSQRIRQIFALSSPFAVCLFGAWGEVLEMGSYGTKPFTWVQDPKRQENITSLFYGVLEKGGSARTFNHACIDDMHNPSSFSHGLIMVCP